MHKLSIYLDDAIFDTIKKFADEETARLGIPVSVPMLAKSAVVRAFRAK